MSEERKRVNMDAVTYIKKYVAENQQEEAMKRLKLGEPVQYIVGNVDFYGNLINVNSNVLIPRFETEGLVEGTIARIQEKFHMPIDILDLCTGSGCIAIALKKQLDANIVATDISLPALEVAKTNIELNQVDITLIQSNLFEHIDGKFDVVISNPPYIAYNEKIDEIVKNNEPSLALYAGNDGLYYYEKILKNISSYLKKSYLIAFEIGYKQACQIEKLVHQYLEDVTVTIGQDLQGKDRYLWIEHS